MAHRDFDALRAETQREFDPITFTLFGQTFTCVNSPRLADTFDLMDAPEITPQNEAQAVRHLARYIRKMLIPEDQSRWDQALQALGMEDAHVVIELGTFLAQEYSRRPFGQPSSSSDGPSGTGTKSKRGGGRTASTAGSRG